MSEPNVLNLDRPLRALSFVAATPWAVTPEMLETITEVASLPRDERFQRGAEGILQQAVAAKLQRTGYTPEALQSRRGRRMDGTESVTVRDRVAVLTIEGVISRYADFFTMVSGGITLEDLAEDFQAALESPLVDAILLEIDSPGGEAAGISEFAAQVYAARGKKRCVAYVEDLGASAAYWIASAAEELVIGSTARVGSIGVRVPILDTTKQDENRGVRRMQIVSDQSPKKAVDPTTPEGQAQIRATLTALAGVFVADVARYRGVTEEHVLESFGQGDVLLGKAAVAAGMADRLGDFESLLAELQQGTVGDGRSPYRKTAAYGDTKMSDSWFERALRAAGWRPPTTEADDGTPGAATRTEPPPTAQDPLAAENARLRQELADRDRREQEAALAAAAQRITTAAEVWAESAVRAGNATPAERPGLVALYRRAAEADAAQALTDEQRTALGATLAPLSSQVELLKAGVAGRRAVGGSVLTREVLAPGTPPQTFVLPAASDGDDLAKAAYEGAREWAGKANGKGGK